jgi:hypothetical protein
MLIRHGRVAASSGRSWELGVDEMMFFITRYRQESSKRQARKCSLIFGAVSGNIHRWLSHA